MMTSDELVQKLGNALSDECMAIFGSTWNNDVRKRLARAALDYFDQEGLDEFSILGIINGTLTAGDPWGF